MKRREWKLVLLWLVVVLVSAPLTEAQRFAMDFFTISAGGTSSSGGIYSMSSTIGEPAAGAMSGGDLSLSVGFWSVFEPEPPAHSLRIVRSGADVILSWEPATPELVLEMTGSLSEMWAPAASGSTNPVAIQATAAVQFYRLKQP